MAALRALIALALVVAAPPLCSAARVAPAAATAPAQAPRSRLHVGYAEPGPCAWAVTHDAYELPAEAACKSGCRVASWVTLPQQPAPGGPACPPGPYPLVAFFSGFLIPGSAYAGYAEHLASWGFAVLQYDLLAAAPHGVNISALHTDADEARFVGVMLARLRERTAVPGGPLSGQLDWDALATAGHSRGGKLAVWLFTEPSLRVRAAYVIDPVDNMVFNLRRPHDYPSAADRLAGANKSLGVTAASRHDWCNDAPIAAGNYERFWGHAAPGSWLEVVAHTGHMEFAGAGLITSAVEAVCCLTKCTGLLSHELSIYYAAAPLTAWLQRELRRAGAGAGATPVLAPWHSMPRVAAGNASIAEAGFWRWLCRAQAEHALSFEIKGAPGPCGAALEL